MGLRVSDFASVSHIFAFLSSHSGLDFKMPVSASRRVLDLPFATPYSRMGSSAVTIMLILIQR